MWCWILTQMLEVVVFMLNFWFEISVLFLILDVKFSFRYRFFTIGNTLMIVWIWGSIPISDSCMKGACFDTMFFFSWWVLFSMPSFPCDVDFYMGSVLRLFFVFVFSHSLILSSHSIDLRIKKQSGAIAGLRAHPECDIVLDPQFGWLQMWCMKRPGFCILLLLVLTFHFQCLFLCWFWSWAFIRSDVKFYFLVFAFISEFCSLTRSFDLWMSRLGFVRYIVLTRSLFWLFDVDVANDVVVWVLGGLVYILLWVYR